jgi:hypothetical protein
MRAVRHVGEVVAANDSAEGVESAAERPAWIRLRSPEKTAVRAESSAIFDTAATLHVLSNADVGATVNEGKEAVRRMRAGALPVTLDHLLRLARRRPELFEDIVEQLRGSRK